MKLNIEKNITAVSTVNQWNRSLEKPEMLHISFQSCIFLSQNTAINALLKVAKTKLMSLDLYSNHSVMHPPPEAFWEAAFLKSRSGLGEGFNSQD